MRPRIAVRRAQALAAPVVVFVTVAAGLFVAPAEAAPAGDSMPKIGAEILAHRQLKSRPDGVTAEAHAAFLAELGLDGSRPDAERCAVYVHRPLTNDERDAFERQGIEFHPDLWVPPIPGRHPHGFHLATVPYAGLERLRADPRIARVRSTEFTARPTSNLARVRINADDVQDGNGVTATDGTGVKFAVADSGVDLSHPDLPVPVETFDVTDGNSVATWGTDVSNTVIDHGTHVTGVAFASGGLSAGNLGNGGGSYRGGAPGASLYFYKIGNDSTGSTTFSDMIEAVQRAQQVGADVYSMSYGGFNETFMDGASSVCQAVDAAVASGVTVFFSAGNKGELNHHASARIAAGGSASVSFGLTAAGSPLVGFTTLRAIWKDDTPGDANIAIQANNLAAGEGFSEVSSSTSVRGTESKDFLLQYNVPAGQTHEFELVLSNTAVAGLSPRVHLQRAGGRGKFADGKDPFWTVVHPGLCDGAIAVGAWTHRDDWTNHEGAPWSCCGLVDDTLGAYSSRGPRVDGRRKPDLVAPGATMISLRDSAKSTLDARIIDNDGLALDGSGPSQYYALHGTSQATPLAAAVAALVLERDPNLEPSGVRNALIRTASNATSPDDSVGFGLVDALAAVQGLPAGGTDSDGDWFAGAGGGVVDCDDFDSEVWSRPGEVATLQFVDRVTLEWSLPVELGASAVVYDTLRSTDPAEFDLGAVCLESGDGSDRAVFEPAVPAPGEVFHYVVRAVSGCPVGEGSLGSPSVGPERVGKTCS